MAMFLRFLLLTFVLIVSNACATLSNSKIHIEKQKLLPWATAHKDISTAKSPALYEFNKYPKTLLYLAASHTNDPSSETFKKIKWVFENRPPHFIIVEGFATSLGISPQNVIEPMLKGIKPDFYPNGETSYVLELSLKHKVQFIGGEPPSDKVYQDVLSSGFTTKDLYGYYFVRRMPQIVRSKEMEKNSLEEIFDDYIKWLSRDLKSSDVKFTFTEFKDWYRQKQGKEFDLKSGGRGETAPIDTKYFTQKMAQVIGRLRDEHILSVTEEKLNAHDRVFIIYGSSHYRLQHEAIKAAMGEPNEVGL